MSSAPASIPPGFEPFPSRGGFIDGVGPLYVLHEEGRYAMGLRVEPRHCNPMGICHGGMLATFCDMLLPVGAHHLSAELRGRFLPTVSLQLDYLAPARRGSWLEGECQLLKVTRSLVFAQGLVRADGTPAVRCSGVFKIGPPWGDAPAVAAP